MRTSSKLRVVVGFPLTVICEPVEEGWLQARIAELPAVITAGKTEDEAVNLALDALREYILSLGAGSPGQVAPGGWSRTVEVIIDAKASVAER